MGIAITACIACHDSRESDPPTPPSPVADATTMIAAEPRATLAPQDAGADAIPIVPAPTVWRTASNPGQTTLALPRGKHAGLSGEWRERHTLWDDAALVYARDGRDLCVLDGGASKSRRIWTTREERGSLLRDPAWSADGSVLYLWMDLTLQLCALDAFTAHIRSLTALDTHVWHYEGMEHLDP